ncbi:MAG TPA: substrate-binding domain-containing protein, partial [Herpetosiphonaceae bacterium]|nr:substrate-binding domain-containing protein [Herpetosiphonaceae bacterium]
MLRTAEEMGWKRPEDWRAVRRGRFGCAVLLQSMAIDRSYISHNFRVALEDHLLDRNMHLTTARLPDDTLCSETALGRVLRQWSADGVLISYTNAVPPALRRLVAKLRLPAVWLNSSEPVDAIRPDDEDAGAMAARLLLEAGHRRIAYCGYIVPPDVPDDHIHASLRQRPLGARRTIEAAGGSFTDHNHPGGTSIAHWREVLARPDRPTAVICFSPLQVTPVLHAALMSGMAIPADLSLITFHDEMV